MNQRKRGKRDVRKERYLRGNSEEAHRTGDEFMMLNDPGKERLVVALLRMRGYAGGSEGKVAAYRSLPVEYQNGGDAEEGNSPFSHEASFPPSPQTWRSRKGWKKRRGGRGAGRRWEGRRKCVREKGVEVTDVG